MKNYKITIQSITPYMQHRMDDTKLEEWEKNHAFTNTRMEIAQADAVRAEYHCYRGVGESCFIPAEHIRGACITAGTYVKGKAGAQTKSMKSTVAGEWLISPNEIAIPDYQVIDKRSAVNKNVKARIMVIRPRWNDLKASFELQVDNDSTPVSMIEQIFTFAGNKVGIGSYRPTSNGMFGRFKVISVTEIK